MRLKEVRSCWEERSSISFLSRGWRDLTTSGGLARKRPITERPPGSMADTCGEDRNMNRQSIWGEIPHSIETFLVRLDENYETGF